MASKTPPAAYSPKAKGDNEVLSQRTFLGRGEAQEVLEGEAPAGCRTPGGANPPGDSG